MGTPIIEGIDNEVLLVCSVFVALVTILLVQLVYNSNNRNSSARQNESNSSPDCPPDPDSASSSRPEGARQENPTEGRKSYFVATLVLIPWPWYYMSRNLSLISIGIMCTKLINTVECQSRCLSSLDQHLINISIHILTDTPLTLDWHSITMSIKTQSVPNQRSVDS